MSIHPVQLLAHDPTYLPPFNICLTSPLISVGFLSLILDANITYTSSYGYIIPAWKLLENVNKKSNE